MHHNTAINLLGRCSCPCHHNHNAKCVCGAGDTLRARPPKVRKLRSEKLTSRVRPFEKFRRGTPAFKSHGFHALKTLG